MSNDYISETDDYGLAVLEITFSISPDGRAMAYGVVNKKYGVVEAYDHTLPGALASLGSLQAALDAQTGKTRGPAN